MTGTFEDKKKLSEEHFRNSAGASDETTPEAITEAIEKVAAALGGAPQFVPVRQDQFGLFGWCSDGVLEKVKNDGGGIRFGWTIWEWPKIFFTAEFHAVWIAQGGALIDITPKPQHETRILFVPDESYPADFDFDTRPPNRRFRIPQEPDYKTLAEAEISRMKPSQLEYERKRAAKKDMPLLDWMAAKQPRAGFPMLVDELIQVCDAVDRKSDELSGTSNFFSPDREYADLMKRKIALMQAAELAAKNS
ncbi:hypothetical protein N2605_16200 [Bradyrhizobium yuanmingense]|uniref:hypothetical protein n=1 Tax=Bradyrhizobium yuanmingense TaxID=108015 RepID=UPI0021A5DF98|nr:hypothetical protein [Bradyrhizobium sp. CB1024]UWU87918.1 hypothetical protein N2605_16200 [Bradyrhizobium sp. CB1024]